MNYGHKGHHQQGGEGYSSGQSYQSQGGYT